MKQPKQLRHKWKADLNTNQLQRDLSKMEQ